MKTVIFTQAHNYGGLLYAKGDKLICPADRAASLVSSGVAKVEAVKKSKD